MRFQIVGVQIGVELDALVVFLVFEDFLEMANDRLRARRPNTSG